MYKNEEFIQAQILLLIITIVSLFTSFQPYLCILFAGLLMIVFTMRSLSDLSNKQDKFLFAIQVLFSAIFVIAADSVSSFLIFYECRIGKRRKLRTSFPAIAYCVYACLSVCLYACVYEVVAQKQSLPQTICNILVLVAISGLLSLAEWLIAGYLSAKNQISHAVKVTAVNEMYEKQLNRELTIKNYLADKNARLEERENISRNIHNSVGHSITAAIMTLDAADMLFDTAPDKAREKMNIANERIRTSLSAIRHAVRVLDRENEFISIVDFINELNDVIERFVMDTTIEVHTDFMNIDADLHIPHEHTEFLTGAVQELLTNGVRHGNANVFNISLNGDSKHIKLQIYDNGRSDFSKENEQEKIHDGFGLKKLISYVEKCGGTVAFVNKNGFQTEIMLPLIEQEEI